MLLRKSLLLLVIGLVANQTGCIDLFSSTFELEKLYDRETEFNRKLEEHLKDIDGQLKVLDWFLDTYYKNYNYTVDDAVEYVSNPINTYVMLKRTAVHWPHVKASGAFVSPTNNRLLLLTFVLKILLPWRHALSRAGILYQLIIIKNLP